MDIACLPACLPFKPANLLQIHSQTQAAYSTRRKLAVSLRWCLPALSLLYMDIRMGEGSPIWSTPTPVGSYTTSYLKNSGQLSPAQPSSAGPGRTRPANGTQLAPSCQDCLALPVCT